MKWLTVYVTAEVFYQGVIGVKGFYIIVLFTRVGTNAGKEKKEKNFDSMFHRLKRFWFDSICNVVIIMVKIQGRLATDLKPNTLDKMEKLVKLEEIPGYMDEILEGWFVRCRN